MKCPDCMEGKLVGAFHPVILDCPRCNKTGEVPDIQAEWIKAGEEIRNIRRENGLILREAAEMLGINPSELSEYERGIRNPSKLKEYLKENK